MALHWLLASVCMLTACTSNCTTDFDRIHTRTVTLVLADNACKDVSECVVVPTNTKCSGLCGAVINAKYKTAFASELAKIGEDECSGGCSETASCAVSVPACVGGHCIANAD